ncbi:unnamed protein product [Alternaria alternata]
MALLTLLLSWLFVTLASACMFPFNNPRLTNSSLVEEYIADLQTKGGNGWTSPIGPSNPVITAWPKNSASGKVTYIYYCFDSHASYSALKDVVDSANKMWRDKLGPGSTNGHHFDGFRHYYSKNTNSHPRCYKGFPDPWGWNSEVPEGTLVISWNSLGYSQSTVGYDDESIDWDRHSLTLHTWIPRYEDWVLEVAHELGHVLGLRHEHQRFDRDRDLYFDCSKLQGYTEARDTIAAHPEWGFTINQACQSRYLGTSKKELNFWQAAEYALHTVDESHSYGRLIDHNSIMMYSSWANAADLMHGLANLPLVRWKNGPPSNGHAPDHSNAETVQWPTGISDGDKEAIQKLYPWEG